MIEYENLGKVNEPFFNSFYERFRTVLQSGKFILSQQVEEFERRFAAFCHASYCIGTGNGMDALTLALKALNLEEGKEVIVPSNTYIATIMAILNCRLTPVLVEPDPATCNIDPGRIAPAITRNTVAILVVHLYGKCCSMEEVCAIGKKYGLKIIEDCAQAHGAMLKGKKAGTFGDIAAFSFYPTKNLGALGDGGCVVTQSGELSQIVRMLRNYGSQKKYFNDVIGVNSRLDEVQAAFLNVKLDYLERINDHKRRLATLYRMGLKEDFLSPLMSPDYHDVFHIYAIRHAKRDALRSYLLENEVGTEIHYPVPPHRQKALSRILTGKQFPIADEISATTLSLPISSFHSEADIVRVCELLNRF